MACNRFYREVSDHPTQLQLRVNMQIIGPCREIVLRINVMAGPIPVGLRLASNRLYRDNCNS